MVNDVTQGRELRSSSQSPSIRLDYVSWRNFLQTTGLGQDVGDDFDGAALDVEESRAVW